MSASVGAELVTVQHDGDVVVVRLCNPARRNVLTPELTEQLAAALEAAKDASVIVLLAEGEHFCVGGDVRAFGAAADPADFIGSLATSFHRVIRAMRAAPPIVLGVRGWAAGAGMSIVLAADAVVAGSSANLRPAYPGIGVTPDGGMSWMLPRIVGHRRALAILLGNQVLGSAQALQLGLVDDVVADRVVDVQALAFAHRLADGPVGAHAGIKRLLQDAATDSLNEHLDAEAASIAAHAASAEGQEGISSFVEHRKPDYRAARAAH